MKKCATCCHFIYFPPFVQRELNIEPFHCTRDKWRDEQDPAVFEKKIKCKKWKDRKDKPYIDPKLQAPKMVRTIGIKRQVPVKLKRGNNVQNKLTRTKNK